MDLDPDNPLSVEIRHEMAGAYLTACRRMVDALKALDVFHQTAASLPAPEQMTRRRELIEEAAERVYFVVVQREAMKLSADPAFLDRYEVPEEVRRRLGPKPSGRMRSLGRL